MRRLVAPRAPRNRVRYSTVHRNTCPLPAHLQRAPRHEANPGTLGVLSYTLESYTENLSVLSFPLEYYNWLVEYTQFHPQVACQRRVNKWD